MLIVTHIDPPEYAFGRETWTYYPRRAHMIMYNENFSIISKINIAKLDEGIEEFKDKTTADPYIFVSLKTIRDLPIISQSDPHDFQKGEWVGFYRGNRVFIDPTKEYGEVELR